MIIQILIIADYVDVVARKAGAEDGVGGVMGQSSSNDSYSYLIMIGSCLFHFALVWPYPTEST
jgi:hypothetical protein